LKLNSFNENSSSSHQAQLITVFKNNISKIQNFNIYTSTNVTHADILKVNAVIEDLLNNINSIEKINIAALNQYLIDSRTELLNFQSALNTIMFNQLKPSNNNLLIKLSLYESLKTISILAKQLNEESRSDFVAHNQMLAEEITSSIYIQNIASVISIICVLIIGLFLFVRIIEPMRYISETFSKLIIEGEIKDIPGIYRSDEIGMLARAANVFHNKNIELKRLISQTQQHNESQATLNRELVKEKIKAEHASKSKSAFLANMSHEIRTPMNGIIGLLDIVLSSELTQEQRDDLAKVSFSTQILMGVINDILDFSKIEAGKLTIENTPFETSLFFESFLSNISIIAQRKNLSLKFYCSPSLPDILVGDPLRISQVLFNLCNNAIKFTQVGYVEILIKCEPTEDFKKINLSATIIDTGIGMNEDQQRNIFASFNQADESTSRKFGGTGLGLSIAKQLVKLMSGEILVDSQLGKGSTFTCNFKVGFEQNKVYKNNLETSFDSFQYFLSHKEPFIPSDYIEELGIKAKYQSIKLVRDIQSNQCNSSIILIDIHTLKDYLKIYEYINVKFKHLNIVLIIDKSIEKQLLLNNLKLPDSKLFSPFTFTHFKKFIESIFLSKKMSNTIINNKIIEDTPQKFEAHILVVEDNMINQIVITKILKSFGLTYDVANDGQQALDKINKENKYDLILMDIQMPIMDGYTATKHLRAIGLSDLIICGLSANAMKQDFDKAFSVGMNDYLTKPIDKKALCSVFEKYLCKSEVI